MKRLALAASIFVLAACGAKEEAAPAADSAAPAVAPVPAAVDSAMPGMTHDSTAKDTTKM
jgi:hypothetical protein